MPHLSATVKEDHACRKTSLQSPRAFSRPGSRRGACGECSRRQRHSCPSPPAGRGGLGVCCPQAFCPHRQDGGITSPRDLPRGSHETPCPRRAMPPRRGQGAVSRRSFLPTPATSPEMPPSARSCRGSTRQGPLCARPWAPCRMTPSRGSPPRRGRLCPRR